MLRIIFRIFLGLFFFVGMGTSMIFAKEPITVVFRYDDYANYSGPIEDKLIQTFIHEQIPITLGVIPFGCDGTPLKEEKIAVLKDGLKTGLIEVAVHGYCHTNINPPEAICFTEFEGEKYSIQEEKITKAKEYLEKTFSVPMNTFIPPFNTYDLTTFSIVENLKFKTLSADKNRMLRKHTTLNILPKTCDLLQLKAALEGSQGFLGSSPTIVVLLHPYDFKEITPQRAKFTFEQMVEIIKWVKQQPNVRFQNIGQAVESTNEFNDQRYLNYQRSLQLREYIPENRFLNFWIPGEVYLSFSALLWVVLKFIIFCLGILFLEIFLVQFLAKVFKRENKVAIREIVFTTVFLIIYVQFYEFSRSNLGAEGFVGLVVILGIVFGVWYVNWQSYRERKKNVFKS
jgi:hypothetical protein